MQINTLILSFIILCTAKAAPINLFGFLNKFSRHAGKAGELASSVKATAKDSSHATGNTDVASIARKTDKVKGPAENRLRGHAQNEKAAATNNKEAPKCRKLGKRDAVGFLSNFSDWWLNSPCLTGSDTTDDTHTTEWIAKKPIANQKMIDKLTKNERMQQTIISLTV
jgi:hypothetical protein